MGKAKESSSERRLAENEVVFRRLNEQVHKGYEETNRLAREDDQLEFAVDKEDEDTPLRFFCECADEKCAQRVMIKLSDYNEIHSRNDRFVVVPGHELLSIEEIVSKQPGYYVVQKYAEPPHEADTLHPTSLHNA